MSPIAHTSAAGVIRAPGCVCSGDIQSGVPIAAVALVRALRKLDPGVRVIASSGHFQKENIVVLEGLGVKTFLDKPYTDEKLLRAVSQALAPVKPA